MEVKEKRKIQSGNPMYMRSTPLPVDYAKMVQEVLLNGFSEQLREYSQYRKNPRFQVSGGLFLDEIVVSISLVDDDKLAATTVHASTDFDPQAEKPTAEDLLSKCIDAAGGVFGELMDLKAKDFHKRVEHMAKDTLKSLVDLDSIQLPFKWSEMKIEKTPVHVKIDKSNPAMDAAADEWLAENDPEHKKRMEEERQAAEGKFVTGKPKGGNGS